MGDKKSPGKREAATVTGRTTRMRSKLAVVAERKRVLLGVAKKGEPTRLYFADGKYPVFVTVSAPIEEETKRWIEAIVANAE